MWTAFPRSLATASSAPIPKKFANPRSHLDSDTLVATLDYGSLRVAIATMGYKHRAITDEQAKAEIHKPIYIVKIMPGYDGKPRICGLACATISEIVIKGHGQAPAQPPLFTPCHGTHC
jgi:acetoacetate decarboxylase